MLNTEEKALSIFNASIKQCTSLGITTSKENALEISFIKVMAIKEALYDSTHLDQCTAKKSLEYWSKVQQTLEKL